MVGLITVLAIMAGVFHVIVSEETLDSKIVHRKPDV